MKLYKTRVRLAGSILNEVWLHNVTPAQLLVLTEIHKGGDNFPLAEVTETGSVQRTDARERERLRREYLDWNLGQGEKLLRDVLGPPGTPLPQFYAPPISEVEDYEEYDDTVAEPTEDEVLETLAKPVEVIRPVRTKVPRGGLKPEDVTAAE
ncbi:MAG TPA: hypothetical protein VNO55_08740 [Polyangia bacterium]|nr:hypothetical protein [Polyangia bacterium]